MKIRQQKQLKGGQVYVGFRSIPRLWSITVGESQAAGGNRSHFFHGQGTEIKNAGARSALPLAHETMPLTGGRSFYSDGSSQDNLPRICLETHRLHSSIFYQVDNY